MHVDGAYGGAAALTEELAPLFSGIEHADSVGFDPHKWLYTPIPGAVVLVRDFDLLHRAFGLHETFIVEDTETTGWGQDMAFLTPNFSQTVLRIESMGVPACSRVGCVRKPHRPRRRTDPIPRTAGGPGA